MTLYVAASFNSLSAVALSKQTALLALSLTFPLDHFFLFLPEEAPADDFVVSAFA